MVKKKTKKETKEVDENEQTLEYVANMGFQKALDNYHDGTIEESPFEQLRRALDDIELELASKSCSNCSGCENKCDK